MRPDNQRGYPVEPVRYGHTGRGSPPLAQAKTPPNPPPPPTNPPGPPPPPPPGKSPPQTPPNRPSQNPPSPQGDLRPTVSWGGSWRPEPRSRRPQVLTLLIRLSATIRSTSWLRACFQGVRVQHATCDRESLVLSALHSWSLQDWYRKKTCPPSCNNPRSLQDSTKSLKAK